MSRCHRFELLRPRQIEAIRAVCPVAMFPFGSLEFHGRHLPVGLDAVKAHELLMALAERTGGVVLPPFFVGTGGGHYGYEWTIMGDREHIEPLMTNAFRKMYQFGFRVQVAITGHYPPEQKDMLQSAAEAARKECPGLQIWAGPEYDAVKEDAPRRGDHAAKWETSILEALRPDLVSMGELNLDGKGRPAPFPQYANEQQAHHQMSDNQEDPLYGILGSDPRIFASAALGDETVRLILNALVTWVLEALKTVRS